MAFEEAVVKVSRPAGADLSAAMYLAVKLNSSSEVVKVSALTDATFGILQNDPVAGQAAAIAIGGICKAKAGATLAAGDVVAANTAGKLIVGATGSKAIGTVVVGGAADEIVSVLIGATAPVKA